MRLDKGATVARSAKNTPEDAECFRPVETGDERRERERNDLGDCGSGPPATTVTFRRKRFVRHLTISGIETLKPFATCRLTKCVVRRAAILIVNGPSPFPPDYEVAFGHPQMAAASRRRGRARDPPIALNRNYAQPSIMRSAGMSGTANNLQRGVGSAGAGVRRVIRTCS